MKKTSIVLLLILSLVICLFSCRDESGNVKDNGQANDSESEKAELPFDGEKVFYRENGSIEKIVKREDGKTLWIREYGENGEFIRYTEYTLYGHFAEDKTHSTVTEKITFYDTDGNIIEAIAYEYHESGAVHTETFYSEIGDVKGISEYDESGILVKSRIYEKEGENYLLSESVEFTYDADGRPLKDTCYRADGSLLSINQYSENGDTLKNTRYDEDGLLASYTVYEYSEDRTKLREICYTSLETVSSVCEYREDGSKARLINYFKNGIISLIYNYDERGHIQRIEKYESDGSPSSVEEFDESGARLKYISFNYDQTTLVYDGNYNIIEGVRYLSVANGAFIKYEYLDGVIRRETVRDDSVARHIPSATMPTAAK